MNSISANWAACIVHYQDQLSLRNLVQNLDEQNLKPLAVFIADNNSDRDITLNNYSFPIEIIKLSENKGFAAGANVAIRKAISKNFENFILLSQDVILERDTTEKLLSELNATKSLVFPTMIDRTKNKIFSKGGTINIYSGAINLCVDEVPPSPDWADGSCLVFTKELYLSVDGFNEDYFMYFEDVDFCYRAKGLGFKLSHVETTASQTPRGPSPLLRSKNSVILARRNGPQIFKFSITLRNILGAIKLLLQFKIKESKNRLTGVILGWSAKID